MNPKKSLRSHLLDKSTLESLMLKDMSVIPHSVIKTFSHLKADDVDFILSSSKDSLDPGSFVIRQGDFARFFLDIWFDPLYRNYNFVKAETHALVRCFCLFVCCAAADSVRITSFNGIRLFSQEWRWYHSGP